MSLKWIMSNIHFVFIYFILYQPTSSYKYENLQTNFSVIWNVPSFKCEDRFGIHLNLRKYGIITNKDDAFRGDAVAIFYKKDLGLYPWIDRDGAFINGGLPQLADLNSHLDKVSADLDWIIQDRNFTGIAVIDWEEWRPIFVRNGFNEHQKVYIDQSEAHVRQLHPDWSEDRIRQQAEKDFERAARLFMQRTLEVCRQLRPGGKWGFYGFPSCYNYKPGKSRCSEAIVEENNRLSWMFKSSSAIFPSIYLEESFGTHEDRHLRVQGELQESLRVRYKFCKSDTHIFPYTRYRYGDTADFYDLEDLNNTLGLSFSLGLSGAVLWDSYDNLDTESRCQSLDFYINKTLGTYIENFTQPADFQKRHSHLIAKSLRKTWHQQNSFLWSQSKVDSTVIWFNWFFSFFKIFWK